MNDELLPGVTMLLVFYPLVYFNCGSSNSNSTELELLSSHAQVIMQQTNLSEVIPDVDFTDCNADKALSSKIRDLSRKDRDILEKGSRAFISFVRAYKEHRCQYIFRLKELDLLAVAETFALLKLPRIPELKGLMNMGRFKQEFTTLSDIEVV